ncbi:hypothetical protein [Mycolicibacterium sediminis]|uniref:Uncharacterized protein n=1 Tax=Mycolicibacterium sediminis TaxID=1286180 RepID=A0A7I7QTH2_9MYCO|nr:hypothetical protein [Mycolicibacterium sediminis]BBY29525.1 hypothetical protein MSEDJ_36210 [Mycolicibacterium sediminis]
MPAESPTSRTTFEESLSAALARGEWPTQMAGLGPLARSAIEAVAREHPDATVHHIAEAYDAFGRESA